MKKVFEFKSSNRMFWKVIVENEIQIGDEYQFDVSLYCEDKFIFDDTIKSQSSIDLINRRDIASWLGTVFNDIILSAILESQVK